MSKLLKKRASFEASTCEHLEPRRLLSYSFIDLGTLGGNSTAKAVNGPGQVVGFFYEAGSSTLAHGFLWQNGVMSNLGTLGGTTSVANDINDSGMIVGNSRTAESTDAQLVMHAYVWQNGVMTDLGTLGGTVSNAKGINNRGQIVGSSTTADGASRGVLWENGAIYDLNTLLPANSGWQITGTNTNAINDSGQIVGQGLINGHQHAFRISDSDGIYANGGAVITDLGTLGGPNSNGIAINNLGQVAGSSNTSDGSLRAFRYSGSTITDLKSVYGISNGSGINDAGLVVGGSEYRGWTYANEWHAFLWQAGKIADLNLQLPRGSTWTLEVAYDINKDGRIVGSMLVSGQRHAFMMVPSGVSTPLTVAAAPASTTFSAVPITEGASEVLAVDGATVLR